MEQEHAVMVGRESRTTGGSGEAGRGPGPAVSPAVIDWHVFVGTPDAVAGKLFELPASVLEHQLAALLLQGSGKADVHVFERAAPNDREGPVHVWQGSSLGSLPGDLVAILSAKNVTTVLAGAMREILYGHGDYADLGVVPCPPTPRGAFGHPLKRYAADSVVHAFVLGL